MDFRILGPLSSVSEGHTASLERAQRRSLLAYLLWQAGRVVSRQQIDEALWGGAEPATARQQVANSVSMIRRHLATDPLVSLETVGTGYLLSVPADRLDLGRFIDAVDAASRCGDGRRAVQLLSGGLAEWRGEPFGGSTAAFVVAARRELREQHLHAVEMLYGLRIAGDNLGEVIADLRRDVAGHPERERLRRHLMLALYRDGRPSDALAVYREARAWLAAETGTEPGPDITALFRAMLAGDSDLRGSDQAIGYAVPAQLPSVGVHFVGRQHQLDRIDQVFRQPGPGRPVTVLTGAGGTGKTTLAVQWAHRQAEQFPDGQLVADLRGYGLTAPTQPIDVLQGFLRALGIPESQIPTGVDEASALYRTTLAERRLLIVLDDARAADQVRPLLPGAGECMVLITSRDRLDGLAVTHDAVRVETASLAPRESAALLSRIIGTDRARAETEAVRKLARLCEHLPLALRIVAARLAAEPERDLAQFAAELSHGNRLDALTIDGDDQTAVRTTFRLSLEALPDPVRSTFALLGLVPSHDFTLGSVSALSGVRPADAARVLARLAAAHLVRAVGNRYTMHDLLREYAASTAAQLSAEIRDTALDALVSWYLAGLQAAWALLYPPAQPYITYAPSPPYPVRLESHDAALDWCDAERDNVPAVVRAAAAAGRHAAACDLAAATVSYYDIRKHWQDWIETHEVAAASAAELGDQARRARALAYLGVAHHQRGDWVAAAAYKGEALQLSRACGDRRRQAITLGSLAITEHRLGRVQSALRNFAASIKIHRERGDTDGEGVTLNNLSNLYLSLGRAEKAVPHLLRALDIQQRIDGHSTVRAILCTLGEAYSALGQHGDAQRRIREAVAITERTGERWGLAETLTLLGRAQQAAHDPAAAGRTWRRAIPLFEECGDYPAADKVRTELDAAVGRQAPSTV